MEAENNEKCGIMAKKLKNTNKILNPPFQRQALLTVCSLFVSFLPPWFNYLCCSCHMLRQNIWF